MEPGALLNEQDHGGYFSSKCGNPALPQPSRGSLCLGQVLKSSSISTETHLSPHPQAHHNQLWSPHGGKEGCEVLSWFAPTSKTEF